MLSGVWNGNPRPIADGGERLASERLVRNAGAQPTTARVASAVGCGNLLQPICDLASSVRKFVHLALIALSDQQIR